MLEKDGDDAFSNREFSVQLITTLTGSAALLCLAVLKGVLGGVSSAGITKGTGRLADLSSNVWFVWLAAASSWSFTWRYAPNCCTGAWACLLSLPLPRYACLVITHPEQNPMLVLDAHPPSCTTLLVTIPPCPMLLPPLHFMHCFSLSLSTTAPSNRVHALLSLMPTAPPWLRHRLYWWTALQRSYTSAAAWSARSAST